MADSPLTIAWNMSFGFWHWGDLAPDVPAIEAWAWLKWMRIQVYLMLRIHMAISDLANNILL